MAGKEEQQSEAFARFRPVCVQLTREHTRSNVAALQQQIHATRLVIVEELQEYVLFPLRLILKQTQNKSEEFLIDIIKCTTQAFGKMTISRWELFQDCFTSICVFISSRDPTRKVAVVSEELKLAVVNCLSSLAENTQVENLENAYKPSFLPALGHAISLLLHLIETEPMRELRVACMNCLMDLSGVNRKLDSNTKLLVGDTFAAFLPGISMAMAKVATGDEKQGQMITKSAIDVWAQIVAIVLDDESLNSVSTEKVASIGNQPFEKLIIVRTPDWVSMTTGNLKILVQRISPLAGHDSWKVRLSVVKWAHTLLSRCQQSMEPCMSEFLEVLVSRVGDSYESVALASKQALTDFQKSRMMKSDSSVQPLIEILEENLHKLATSLPRLMRTADDNEKHCTLCLFNGYLRLLGPHITKLLHSASHLQRISLALLQILELDCGGVTIIREQSSAITFNDLNEHRVQSTRTRKYFLQFNDVKVLEELTTTCRLLGYYGDLDLLVDHFLEKFLQTPLYQKQSAIILNEVILGTSGLALDVDIPSTSIREQEFMGNIIKSILDEYLQPDNWDVLTTNHPTDDLASKGHSYDIVPVNQSAHSLSSVKQINSNILQVCVMLEGVSNCARIMGTDFQYHLMNVLYPVLEKLGSENAHISESAYGALSDIARACNCKSISDLLLNNADYLVNSISLRLRHLDRNPKAPVVLQVMLKYSSVDILPLVNDTVCDILHSLDDHYGDHAMLFLNVLKALVTSISKWFPSEKSSPSAEESATTFKQHIQNVNLERKEAEKTAHSIGEIAEYFREYHKNKEIVDNLAPDVSTDQLGGDAEDTTEGYVEPEDTDDKDKEIPKHVKMTMDVLGRCAHLLAAPQAKIRLLILDTVAQCCLALRDSQNELLPLIHKIWNAFALRFQDEDQLVVIKSFKVLKVIADTSGDFVRQRTVQDVVPKLVATLNAMVQTSVRAGPVYKYTVACRLQLAILQNIGPLCQDVGLMEHHLGQVMASVMPYLSGRQHQVLQEAALMAFHIFGQIEPDHVWLILNDVSCPLTIQRPDDCFADIKMAGSRSRNEYTDNVQKVLETLN